MSQGYDTTPHAAVTIEADDDEDDLVAISGSGANANAKSKGKGPEQRDSLAPPSQSASRSTSPAVSGRIGGGSMRPLRTEIGGIKVETRYSGVSSLDESVGDSLVRMNATRDNYAVGY